jgi:SAM-dependent methyltransferase
MPDKVDLYNTSYGHNAEQTYREIRLETYGEDFGQTSFATIEEFAALPGLLELTPHSMALEIGCGAGGCALQFAREFGCRVIGADVNAEGIRAANESARAAGLAGLVTFRHLNAGERLPFEAASFDAAYSNDAMCHIPDRLAVLREFHRVLKPGGLLAFSDALVISGAVSNEELATRSSIGFYLFVPRGENERLLAAAGFQLVRADDTTLSAATLAKRWHDSRDARKAALVAFESEPNFLGLQRFLSCVHTLTSERRLSRFLYLVRK